MNFIVRKHTSHQLRDLFLIGGGLTLCVYILLRVIHMSFSIDEQGSYFMFVLKGEIFPREYNVFSANNHALNTFLMWVCDNVFGNHQFSLRLPNLLAGGLYIFSIAMIARRIRYPLAGVLVFVLATASPFLIEYFGVARGYGLANGLFAFAFWQMWLYCDNGYQWKNLIGVLLPSVLGVFAHYSYLNLFLPLAGCAFLISVWAPAIKRESIKIRLLKAGSFLLAIAGVLAVVIPISLKISAAGGFWLNSFKLFWDDSVASVVDASLMNVTHDKGIIQTIVEIAQVITVLAFVRIVWWTIQQWRKREFPLFPLALTCTLLLAGLSVTLQYHLLDTPLPQHRMCLFLLWPWLLLVGIAASLPSKFNHYVTASLLMISGVGATHFIRTMNLEDAAFGPCSVQVDDAIRHVRNKIGINERTLFGYDDNLRVSGIGYYSYVGQMKDFDHAPDSFMMRPLVDYCLISKEYTGNVGANWIPEQSYINGNVLYRNTKRPREIVTAYQQKLDIDTTIGVDGALDKLMFFGYVSDSIFAPIGMLMHIRYAFLATEEEFQFIEATIIRGDQQIFYTRANVYPDGEDKYNGENMLIIPPLQKGDFIVTSLNIDLSRLKRVEEFKVTIEGY